MNNVRRFSHSNKNQINNKLNLQAGDQGLFNVLHDSKFSMSSKRRFDVIGCIKNMISTWLNQM